MILTGVKISSGYAPKGGPQGMRWDLPFTTTLQTIIKDFYQEMSEMEIEFIQSVWVENHANPNPLYLTFQGLGQILKVPANTQGIYPVLVPTNFAVSAATTLNDGTESLSLKCIFLNMPMPFYSSFSAL